MNDMIVPIIVALLAALPGILAWRAQAKKTSLDGLQYANQATMELVEPYRKEVITLREKLEEQEKKIEELERLAMMLDEVITGAHRLVFQLQSHDIIPVWMPPNRRTVEAVEVHES